MTFSRLVLPNPEINAFPVRTPSHLSNQPFHSVEGGADGIFGLPNLVSAGNASMSLSGSIGIAFSQRKTSVTESVRCISRISACARFEIFYVVPAGRYITLQNWMSLAPAVGYSGVYGKSGPHSRRRRRPGFARAAGPILC